MKRDAEDGIFTLRKVFCLGNCARSPNVAIDADVHGRMTPENLRGLISGIRNHVQEQQ